MLLCFGWFKKAWIISIFHDESRIFILDLYHGKYKIIEYERLS